MPLDPQVQAFLKQAAVPGAPALHELPVPQVRELVASMMGANPNSEAVGAVSNLLVPGPGGEIPIRVYLPRNSNQSPDFWLLDLATGTHRQLTRLSNQGTLGSFDITPDGKQIVFDRSRENSDIVLIDLPK